MEKWLPCVGFAGYEVSDQGRVRGVDRVLVDKTGRRRNWKGRIRVATPDDQGYLHLTLNGRTAYVHKLVLDAFVGPRPDGQVRLHGPAGNSVNALSNLRYGTQGENIQQSVEEGNHRNTRKATCPKGHPYDGKNGPNRRCKTCHAANERNRRVHLARSS